MKKTVAELTIVLTANIPIVFNYFNGTKEKTMHFNYSYKYHKILKIQYSDIPF
jgi:hypothetical protein